MNRKSWISSLVLVMAAPVGAGIQPDFEETRSQVLQRCELSPQIGENRLPWYFHYESGVKLLNEGNAKRALEPLLVTANLRPDPARSTRMYGMWFVDYLPYYQLSRAYAALGDWPMAWSALSVSESLGEFKPGDAGFREFAALKALIESKLGRGS